MRRTTALLAAALLLTLSGCTGADPAPAAPAPPSAAPPSAAPGAQAPPVASLEIATSNAQDQVVTLRFDVVSLERDGADTRLALRIANLSDEFEYRPGADLSAGAIGDFTLSGVSLIDLTTDLRHLVLTDTAGGCVCSDVGSTTVPAGSAVDVRASYPSPAADEVDIQLGELGIVPAVAVSDR